MVEIVVRCPPRILAASCPARFSWAHVLRNSGVSFFHRESLQVGRHGQNWCPPLPSPPPHPVSATVPTAAKCRTGRASALSPSRSELGAAHSATPVHPSPSRPLEPRQPSFLPDTLRIAYAAQPANCRHGCTWDPRVLRCIAPRRPCAIPCRAASYRAMSADDSAPIPPLTSS